MDLTASSSPSPARCAPAARTSRWTIDRAGVGFVVALAFGLRVFRLGTQSLWGDETISVFRAYGSIGEITGDVPHEGTLPPLYYYVLHYWILVAGDRETAVRFLSLVFGVLAIPLLYALVRRTLGRVAGLVAATLAAVSPFWIYYSQETRTYALVTALVILAVYLLVRASDRSIGLWCAYAVAAALAVASFYFAGFALAAATLGRLADRRGWPTVAFTCLLAQVGALVLLAPLLLYAGPSMLRESRSVSRASISLPMVLRQLATTFNFGTTVDPAQVSRLVPVALALAALGLIVSPWRQSLFWALFLAVPILAVQEISFVPHPGWERYFIVASPAWYALVAAGLSALIAKVGSAWSVRSPLSVTRGVAGGCLGIATAALLLTGIVPSLGNYYFVPAYWRDDLRAAEQPVEAVATPDVAVIVNGPPQFPSFFYYFRKTIPWFELPAPRTIGEQTVATLDGLTRRYRGLWFVKYHPPDFDPGNWLEVWLDQHAYRVSSRWVENMTFSFYATDDPTSSRVVGASKVDRHFGQDAELVSYRASVVRAQTSDYLLVTLSWQALRTPTEGLRVFAHLLDRGGAIVTQSDHYPEDDLRPASTWRPGDVMDDRFGLKLPADASGRGLHLSVGLYHADGSRLPIDGAAHSDGSLDLPLPGL
ncbi:MAG: glycosyltransferase family 39 protein [Chloroflexota bacterium]